MMDLEQHVQIMSKAVIRVCSVCKAELVKSEGCNKVSGFGELTTKFGCVEC